MLPAGVTPPPGFYPAHHYTDDEKAAEARWMRWGSDCIQKIGRKWDSTVPGAPLFATKREALGTLTRYVTEALPLRALERFGAAHHKDAAETRRTEMPCPECGSLLATNGLILWCDGPNHPAGVSPVFAPGKAVKS